MKKSQEILVVMLVVVAIAGFAILSCGILYKTVITTGDVTGINQNFVYASNILTGLIGGIVALGFGISAPRSGQIPESRMKRSMTGLGGLVATGNLEAPADSMKANPPVNQGKALDAKAIFGFIYSLIYIVIGIAAVVIWISDDKPHEIVKNLATIFLGMVVPIVAGFFNEN